MESLGCKDAFKDMRDGEVLRLNILGEVIPMILGYRDVREAAKNWRTYSSNAPFRVPIPSEEDERSVRQLPIETDPPVHGAYRKLLDPIFRRPRSPEYIERMERLVAGLLNEAIEKHEVEIVREFALPLQSRALALMLELTRSDAETWMSWGTHVFRDGGSSSAKGSALDTYLKEQISQAKQFESKTGFFAALTQMKIKKRPLTEDEMLGMANLVFAGGRDTVINSIALIIAYFAYYPNELSRVACTPRSVNLAVEEFIRVLSPLTHIGRVCPMGARLGHEHVPVNQRISLGWAAANYDPSIFNAPEKICLDRSPNPHVGFGSGTHSCLGAHQARVILRSLVRALSNLSPNIEMIKVVPNIERLGVVTRQVGFDELHVKLAKSIR